MTPLRVQYFHEVFSKNLPSNKPLKILDIGCGGGMISEVAQTNSVFHLINQAMTKLGYQMTGVDLSANTIKQASEHAAQQNLSIRYLQGSHPHHLPNPFRRSLQTSFRTLRPRIRRNYHGRRSRTHSRLAASDCRNITRFKTKWCICL